MASDDATFGTTPEGGPDLVSSFRAAREVTRRHAKSFYFASHALPPGKRREAYAIYAFCRHVDDEVDRAPDGAAVAAALERQRTLLDGLAAGRFGGLAWAPAFVATWRKAGIPRAYFDDLLLGMTLDRGAVRIANWAELDRYCYHVAGVVGLIMTHVFTPERAPELFARARDLGTAMQLTNILRDVGEDLRLDRIYLPTAELAEYGVTEAGLRAGRVTEAFRALMTFQIARAREYYRASEPGIVRLPADGTRRTAWMMADIYGAILGEIEKAGYRVFDRRAKTSLAQKCLLAFGAWRKA